MQSTLVISSDSVNESSISAPQRPNQRWHLCSPDSAQVAQIAQSSGLSNLIAQVLVNHGITTPAAAQAFLNPESQVLPSPTEEFPDLTLSLELLAEAIGHRHKIAICGDYDADGMTSTALLLRALTALGGQVNYAIPSRMQEGYGINHRIVEDFAAEGVDLVLTVDNGIAAAAPIARARELGLTVIVTDHHDLPPTLPPAHAILNPKLLPETSPYASVAGVGVAYILAACLAQKMGQTQHLVTPLLELFTLGTIADLAPLTGVNRRWLKRGLSLLPQSKYAGVQALIQIAGCHDTSPSQKGPRRTPKVLKPEAIGFRLGPRINAVGRIADPQIVIDLLTTDDPQVALERAKQCEQVNQNRQQLCHQIEQDAIALIEATGPFTHQLPLIPQEERVLVLVQPHWHHGVIGIVASRLVDRYGVPVFIGTYEDTNHTQIRGSARGIPEFDVFAALQFCTDLLEKFGGHRAAGGFSLKVEHLDALRSRLSQFAHQHLDPTQLKPLITIDAQAEFDQLTPKLYQEIDALHPCGIGNPEPVFWTPQVQVTEQRIVGKDTLHLKLALTQVDSNLKTGPLTLSAMAWRWGEHHPLPEWIDVAYRLRENTWKGETTLELELLGYRSASAPKDPAQLLHSQVQPSVLTAVIPCPKLPQSPTLPSQQQGIILHCPDPPSPHQTHLPAQWSTLQDWVQLVPKLKGNLLMYGDQRPYISTTTTLGQIEYDRPTHPCDILILWTLPPSWTHLQWLLTLGNPKYIYVRNQIPQLPDGTTLHSRLQLQLAKFPDQPLNLLALGQKWWVAPSTLISALRELGYNCPDFPETCSLEEELQRLRRWYLCSASHLAQFCLQSAPTSHDQSHNGRTRQDNQQ
jgi:single-stranded-DNA-specific exonuclease